MCAHTHTHSFSILVIKIYRKKQETDLRMYILNHEVMHTSFKSTQRDSNYCLWSEVFKNVGQAGTAPALCLQSVHISIPHTINSEIRSRQMGRGGRDSGAVREEGMWYMYT